jgi:hypothetical protein
MLDRVNGASNNPLIDAAGLLKTGESAQSVQETNKQSAENSNQVGSLMELSDGANISEEARIRYEREKEVFKFSRLSQKVDEGTQPDRVSLLKELVNSGRINEYLRTINNEDLAQKILDSSTGGFLKQMSF